MSLIRSARGGVVDFQLLAIKSQLAATPVPKSVGDRKMAIEEKEGYKSESSPEVNEMLQAGLEAAEISETAGEEVKVAPKRK